jgi:hypothetical protein
MTDIERYEQLFKSTGLTYSMEIFSELQLTNYQEDLYYDASITIGEEPYPSTKENKIEGPVPNVGYYNFYAVFYFKEGKLIGQGCWE